MTPEEKQQLKDLVEFKNQMTNSTLIPLGVDQSFRKRFSVPIIVKRVIDFGNVGVQSGEVQTFDIPQAEVGDLIVVTPPNAAIVGSLGGIFVGYVSSTGVVSIKFFNPDTTSALNPGLGTYTVAIFKSQ